MRGPALAHAAALLLTLSACATPRSDLLDRFETTLAAQDSATAALEEWCATRGFAEPATVTATPIPGEPLAPAAATRALLGVSADEPVAYRHVRLSCGGRTLSNAHNWYVPARLTAEMNHSLETSDTPFGKVVAPLGFTRERLESLRGQGEGCRATTVLFHRGLLRLPDSRPISLVIECYSRANLD